jgi:hypothetical protein
MDRLRDSDRIAFYDERFDTFVNGQQRPRPVSAWSQ